MSLSSYHICIEGTIGVGKTSLVNLLAREMDAKTVLEKFEEEGIDDLIEQLSNEEFEYAKSLIDYDIEEIDIRITAARLVVE